MFSDNSRVLLAPSIRLDGRVKASQPAKRVLVPRNITPVRTALAVPQSGPIPLPGIVAIPSAPVQPKSGRTCQRLNPPLTTYESGPATGKDVVSEGQINTFRFVAPIALLLGRSVGSATPPT